MFINKLLDIFAFESAVASLTESVGFKHAAVAPLSDRVGVYVQYVGHFRYG
jgi:hypothetical protein